MNYYTYNKYLKENALKAIGRSITAHTLRHTHASLLLAKGIDVDTISRRLGHEDSRITKEIYLHVTKDLKELDNKQMGKHVPSYYCKQLLSISKNTVFFMFSAL